MNGMDAKYRRFSIVREMLETPGVVRQFPVSRALEHRPASANVFLTGEGSSRIFPAKHARVDALRRGDETRVDLEGGEQCLEYNLAGRHLYAASNSGRTAEIVRLLEKLSRLDDRPAAGEGTRRNEGAPLRRTAVVAHAGGPISDLCDETFVLTCGPEEAVAATKSVVEQALFYDVVFRAAAGAELPDLASLGSAMEETLAVDINAEIMARMHGTGRIYFAGRNDGVAEELALKTNEITRRDSAYLEGTYAVHGVEEVMSSDDVVVVLDPFETEEAKLDDVLVRGVGLAVIAIADHDTRFPTIRVPHVGEYSPYVHLLAGWSLLVETGIEAGIDLDTPARARKIGNEYPG